MGKKIRLFSYEHDFGALNWLIAVKGIGLTALKIAEEKGIIKILKEEKDKNKFYWYTTIELLKPEEIGYFIQVDIGGKPKMKLKTWSLKRIIEEYGVEEDAK